jgi:hypothetical protein
MQRVTHPAAGQGSDGSPEAAGERPSSAASAGPSYVESVLFGRKRRMSAEAPARSANEQERN